MRRALALEQSLSLVRVALAKASSVIWRQSVSLPAIIKRIHETIATNPPGVEHDQSRNRFESLVGLRRFQRVPAASADAE
jgi:hypothetical protein